MADAAQAERNRNLARHHADDRHRDRVGRDLAAAFDEEIVVLPFADVDAAAAAADDHAGVRLGDAQPGVDPRLARRDHADQRRPRVALRIGAVALVPDIVALDRRHIVDGHRRHRRGDAAAELRRVEVGDRPRRAAAAADVIPEALATDAERRHHADAGDDNPGHACLLHGENYTIW